MNSYLSVEEARAVIASGDVLTYPNYDFNIEAFPDSDSTILSPSKLVVDAMQHIGHVPKSIIDIGSGNGRNSFYLAMNGHTVTALDPEPENLGFMYEEAMSLGASRKNFVPRLGTIKDIGSWERYDVALANMVLHYLDQAAIPASTRVVQDITKPGGINVVSVLTDDNPVEESTRGIKHLFGKGELARLYGIGWNKLRCVEGKAPLIVGRNEVCAGKVLVPSVAEIVAVSS